MADNDAFFTGMAARARMRVYTVDAVSLARTPDPSATAVVIRFKNPDGTVLALRTLADGVVNAGSGYYYGTAVPTVEGLHTVEFETGGANPGRDKVQFSVDPF